MRTPFTLVIGLTVGIIAIAAFMAAFQRGTTDIESKYFNKSGSELERTYYSSFPPDSVWGGGGLTGLTGNPAFDLGPDRDHDGLSNAQEITLGTSPSDPDTDGDLMIDGVEIAMGTDPLDATSGGAQKVLPQPNLPPIVPPTGGYLRIDTFYKNVRNLTLNETAWAHLTKARYEDTVSFLIYAELTNTSADQTLTATLGDKLESGLKYINGSGYIQTNNGEKQPLPDSWINQSYPLAISPLMNGSNPVPIQITFNALVTKSPTNDWTFTNNQVLLQTDAGIKRDTAFVQLIKQ